MPILNPKKSKNGENSDGQSNGVMEEEQKSGVFHHIVWSILGHLKRGKVTFWVSSKCNSGCNNKSGCLQVHGPHQVA